MSSGERRSDQAAWRFAPAAADPTSSTPRPSMFSARWRWFTRGVLPQTTPSRRRHRTRGQALVEFALVFPLFLVVFLAVIEFGFAFNALLGIDHAATDAALIAAEIGPQPGAPGNLSVADCTILQSVEDDVSAPADAGQIQTVDIVWADALTGTSKGAGTTTTTRYTRNGTSNCIFADGSSGTMPYSAPSPDNYPATARCNFLKPSVTYCPNTAGFAHTGGPDFVEVKITYIHLLKTPLRNFIPTAGNSLTFIRSSAMRMEPIL